MSNLNLYSYLYVGNIDHSIQNVEMPEKIRFWEIINTVFPEQGHIVGGVTGWEVKILFTMDHYLYASDTLSLPPQRIKTFESHACVYIIYW